jgi:hypothetical protein
MSGAPERLRESGKNDWIVRADVRDHMGSAAREAHARLDRARAALEGPARGGGPLRRLLGAIAWLLPWRRRRFARELAASVGAALEALDRATEWTAARAAYHDTLLGMLARARPPRAWAGAAERPAFLLGTGGGGTRVLGEAAVRLGLHLGSLVNESFDSVEWAPLLYALVEEAGPALDLPRGEAARERILDAARAFHGPWAERGAPWGVKLPEAMLVLPLLLDAFPEARVVLLVRHPVGAALRRAHVTTMPEHPLGRRVLAAAYRAAGRDPALVATDPQAVRNALAWRHQVGRAHRFIEAEMSAERRLVLRLEDFALRPRRTGERLAAFLGLEAPRFSSMVRVEAERLRTDSDPAAAREAMRLSGPLAAAVGYGPGWLDEPCEAPEMRARFAELDRAGAMGP